MTCAPCFAAYMIAAAIAQGGEVTSEIPAFTVTGRIFASGATPVIPVPQALPGDEHRHHGPVPVAVGIEVGLAAGTVPGGASPPGRTAPRRSGTLAWTPVSITATVTPAPRVSGHTRGRIFQLVNHHSPARGTSLASLLGRAWLVMPGTPGDARAGEAAIPPATTAAAPVTASVRLIPAMTAIITPEQIQISWHF